jgi:hypothetical protein
MFADSPPACRYLFSLPANRFAMALKQDPQFELRLEKGSGTFVSELLCVAVKRENPIRDHANQVPSRRRQTIITGSITR